MRPTTILCADWSKSANKRAVWSATTAGARAVRRMFRPAWTLPSLLDEAALLSTAGPVLVVLDVPLGVPVGYGVALVEHAGLDPSTSFLELIAWTQTAPRYFDPVAHTRDWTVRRPFFAVPAGAGEKTAFDVRAADVGVKSLLRHIDDLTAAKSVFVTSGIPGSVGSAACDIWMSLRTLLQRPRAFAVWPFEGQLDTLMDTHPVVVAEVYPRAAYATALLDGTIAQRPRLKVAKTDPAQRHAAIEQLVTMSWVRTCNVRLEDLSYARDNEDDFDACITAAALLRCAVENLSFSARLDDSARLEGGILGSGSINLTLREATYRATKHAWMGGEPRTEARSTQRIVERERSTDRHFPCPIPGCSKVFLGSRGGWDAHVGALRRHPTWHADVTSPEERRDLFKREFEGFFER